MEKSTQPQAVTLLRTAAANSAALGFAKEAQAIATRALVLAEQQGLEHTDYLDCLAELVEYSTQAGDLDSAETYQFQVVSQLETVVKQGKAALFLQLRLLSEILAVNNKEFDARRVRKEAVGILLTLTTDQANSGTG